MLDYILKWSQKSLGADSPKSAKTREKVQKQSKRSENKRKSAKTVTVFFVRFFRDAETTMLIKFAFWRGLGRGKFTENCPRMLFFPGKYHDNKIWKFCKFYCQKFCCHLGGSYFLAIFQWLYGGGRLGFPQRRRRAEKRSSKKAGFGESERGG